MRNLNDSDKRFIRKLAKYFKVKSLEIAWDSSQKKWPDIWVKLGDRPVIVVTDEWSRQPTQERHKRLVHELVGHLVFGWKHNKEMDSVGFSTYPEYDTMSKRIYNDILGNRLLSPSEYIRTGRLR